ncbi:MAG: DUF6508 domain-containing protein [bacterium]
MPSRLDGLPVPDPADVAAVAWYLPLLEQAGPEFGAWQEDGPGTARLKYCPDAQGFVRMLRERGWVETGIRPGAAAMVLRHWHQPELVAGADSATLRALLSDLVHTTDVCEGHLLDAYQHGYLLAILRRLKELARTGSREPA